MKQLQLEHVQQERAVRIRSTIEELKEDDGNLSVDQFWMLRKRVLGRAEERTSIITNEGIEVFTEDAIVDEYRKEFSSRLSHRTIHPDYVEYEKKSNEVFTTI